MTYAFSQKKLGEGEKELIFCCRSIDEHASTAQIRRQEFLKTGKDDEHHSITYILIHKGGQLGRKAVS